MDNKTILDTLSRQFDMKREDTRSLLSDFYAILTDCCIAGDSVVIPGFGQFEPRKKMERISVHPATGKKILIPPKQTLAFKPSAVLKGKVNGNAAEETER